MDKLNAPVTELHGVGKVRAAAYGKLHIHTVRDLLCHYPRAYENRGNTVLLENAVLDGVTKSSVVLTVGTEPRKAMIRRGMNLLKFKAYDDSAVCEITFFNQDYLKSTFVLGSTFRFFGKVEVQGKHYSMGSPAFEPYAEGVALPPYYPVYRLSEGLSQKQIMQNMEEALTALPLADDPLPEEIRTRFRLCTKAFALREIHNPNDYKSMAIAKRRLVFDELFTFALGLTLIKRVAKTENAVACTEGDIERFKSCLEFRLTNAQERSIGEIYADMGLKIPMSRMLVGDVGCGKTAVAAAAIFRAVSSGMRAALMVPTEILANQHYDDLKPFFDKLGFRTALLTGSVTAANKRKIYAGLTAENSSDGVQIVIGTQALIADAVEIGKLGLVITDEQHRFGVGQRAELMSKNLQHANSPHLLVMSATPIPRSLALVLYGDLAISKIDEMPLGRQRVDTFTVDESYRERLDGFIRKNVDAGGQVYIVCPAVEERECGDDEVTLSDIGEYVIKPEDDTPPLKAAVTYAAELEKRLPGYRIAFVHGKLKAGEKDRIMGDFATGNIQILVSTTVIEVGVNVPNATLMIVENAERFGLSQLHQLRGRVGRGKRKSYCILVAGAPLDGEKSIGANAKKRLEVMRTTYDGYTIAERDLEQRGPGDFLGSKDGSIRQSGGFEFKLADMCEDSGMLYDAFDAAGGLLATDPELDNHKVLRQEIADMFESKRDIVN